MKNMDVEKYTSDIKRRLRMLLRGFLRTVYGALVAGLIVIAVYGFVALRRETGYTAVCDFVASCATLLVALSNMYAMGAGKRKRK